MGYDWSFGIGTGEHIECRIFGISSQLSNRFRVVLPGPQYPWAIDSLRFCWVGLAQKFKNENGSNYRSEPLEPKNIRYVGWRDICRMLHVSQWHIPCNPTSAGEHYEFEFWGGKGQGSRGAGCTEGADGKYWRVREMMRFQSYIIDSGWGRVGVLTFWTITVKFK